MIIINSPQDLYQSIKDLKIPDPTITHFMGIMYLYLNGCPCDADKHWESALSVYRRMNESNLSALKNQKNDSTIQFYLDGKLLFEV
jgi:hypothetical protein